MWTGRGAKVEGRRLNTDKIGLAGSEAGPGRGHPSGCSCERCRRLIAALLARYGDDYFFTDAEIAELADGGDEGIDLAD